MLREALQWAHGMSSSTHGRGPSEESGGLHAPGFPDRPPGPHTGKKGLALDRGLPAALLRPPRAPDIGPGYPQAGIQSNSSRSGPRAYQGHAALGLGVGGELTVGLLALPLPLRFLRHPRLRLRRPPPLLRPLPLVSSWADAEAWLARARVSSTRLSAGFAPLGLLRSPGRGPLAAPSLRIAFIWAELRSSAPARRAPFLVFCCCTFASVASGCG